MSKLAMVAVSETYGDVEKLLHKIVWKFQKKHGGCHDELMAEANFLFMKAYGSMSKTQNRTLRFTTWLSKIVWYGLLDHLNSVIKWQTRLPRTSETALDRIRSKDSFNMDAFVDNLSPDAKVVAKLAVNPPPDILLSAKHGHGRHNGTTMRRALVEFLSDICWATERITESFHEIQEVLGS